MNNEKFVVPKWLWIAMIVLALFGLGVLVSPRDHAGRPILLLPDTKAVEDYRRSIADWHSQMSALDAQIASVLSGKFGNDLFSKSREAQKVMETAIGLAQEIDRQDVPTSAIPAKSLLIQSAAAYLDASRAMLDWVTAPTESNLAVARQKLESARNSIFELERSEWIHP